MVASTCFSFRCLGFKLYKREKVCILLNSSLVVRRCCPCRKWDYSGLIRGFVSRLNSGQATAFCTPINAPHRICEKMKLPLLYIYIKFYLSFSLHFLFSLCYTLSTTLLAFFCYWVREFYWNNITCLIWQLCLSSLLLKKWVFMLVFIHHWFCDFLCFLYLKIHFKM